MLHFRTRWCVCALGSVALAATTVSAEPRRPTHIACIGDSITQGVGASNAANNYVSRLQAALGDAVDVRNFGVSGSTMLDAPLGNKPYWAQARFNAATQFVDSAPDGSVVSVVIMLGTNDSKGFNWQNEASGGTNAQQFVADYREMVNHFQALSSTPVVYVVQPLAVTIDAKGPIDAAVIAGEQLALIAQIGADERVPVIDAHTGTVGRRELFGDGIHPNNAGYEVMANLIQIGLEREPVVQLTSAAPEVREDMPLLLSATPDAAATVNWTQVEFFLEETSLGIVNEQPFELRWMPPGIGAHLITARATDTTGATGSSAAIRVSVLAAPPPVAPDPAIPPNPRDAGDAANTEPAEGGPVPAPSMSAPVRGADPGLPVPAASVDVRPTGSSLQPPATSPEMATASALAPLVPEAPQEPAADRPPASSQPATPPEPTLTPPSSVSTGGCTLTTGSPTVAWPWATLLALGALFRRRRGRLRHATPQH